MVIVCGVQLLQFKVAEIAFVFPHKYPFVLQGIRNCVCLQYSWCYFDYAVPCRLEAVFAVHNAVHSCYFCRESLFSVVFFSFFPCQRFVPQVKFCLGYVRGVFYVQGVQHHKFGRISGCHQGVTGLCPRGGVAQFDIIPESDRVCLPQ